MLYLPTPTTMRLPFVLIAIASIACVSLVACNAKRLPETETASPPTTPTPTPKPIQDDSRLFAKIKLSPNDLKLYRHSTGVFQLEIPQGWQERDTSKQGELIVSWTDSTGNAIISAIVTTKPDQTTGEQLDRQLETLVRQTFGSQPDFRIDKPESLSDGSMQVTWQITAVSEGKRARLQGISTMLLQGDKLAVLHLGAIAVQFPELKSTFTKITNTYRIDDSVNIQNYTNPKDPAQKNNGE